MKMISFKKIVFLFSMVVLLVVSSCTEDKNPQTFGLDFVNITKIEPFSAAVSCGIVDPVGVDVTKKGFCFSKTVDPTVENSTVVNCPNTFAANLTLEKSTKYFVRAFAGNDKQIFYSENYIVTTPAAWEAIFTETFATGIPANWTNIDKDGDGNLWTFNSAGYVQSYSYNLANDGALNPENYLISPVITIPSTAQDARLNFNIAAGLGSYGFYMEQYKVVISESPITIDNCRNAVVLRPYTELTEKYDELHWQTENINLKNYIGKKVYIGIVHGNSSYLWKICVDDVSVSILK